MNLRLGPTETTLTKRFPCRSARNEGFTKAPRGHQIPNRMVLRRGRQAVRASS